MDQFVQADAAFSSILPLPLGKGKLVGVLERSEGMGFVLIILIKQISRTGFKNMAK